MKIGVKTFDDEEFLEYFKDKSDFFEVQAIRKNNYSFLKNFKIPIVIHAEHHGFGINPADKKIFLNNLDSINFAIKIADFSNAKKIIAHPGILKNESCSYETAIDFYKNINDDRILIENVPFRDKESICTTPKEIKQFLLKTNKKFCFDINHSIQTSLKKNIDYVKTIKEFIKLNPSHYHIGGQKLNVNDIAHKSFSNSDLDLKKIINLLPKDAEITLEVSIDTLETEKDLNMIRNIIKELNINK